MAMDIVRKTQKRVEKSRKKLAKTISLKSYRKLAVNFLILSVNLIIIILYFSLSQAKIIIKTDKEDVSKTIKIPIVEIMSDDNKLAIAGKISETQVEASETFAVDAFTEIPAQAQGTLTIHNVTSDRHQILVKNTQFANEAGAIFRLNERVDINPGETATVGARADKEGADGEITAGRLQVVLLPYLKDKIYAEISQPFTGGIKNLKTLTPAAYNAAKIKVESALKEKAKENFKGMDYDFSDDDLSIKVDSFNSSANPGDTDINEYTITAQAAGKLFSYDAERAKELIKQELIKSIPPNKILVNFVDDSFMAKPDEEAAVIEASITARVQPKISELALNREDIVGMNKEELNDHFKKITGIQGVEINFSPFWVRSVPNLKDNVDIEIKK